MISREAAASLALNGGDSVAGAARCGAHRVMSDTLGAGFP